jgi:hypothetical protein
VTTYTLEAAVIAYHARRENGEDPDEADVCESQLVGATTDEPVDLNAVDEILARLDAE